MVNLLDNVKEKLQDFSVSNNKDFGRAGVNYEDYIFIDDMNKKFGKKWYKKGIFVGVTSLDTENREHISDLSSMLVWLPMKREKLDTLLGTNKVIKAYKIYTGIYYYMEEVRLYMGNVMSYALKGKLVSYFEKLDYERTEYKRIAEVIEEKDIKVDFLTKSKIDKEIKRYNRYQAGDLYVYKESEYDLPQGYIANGFPVNKYACIPYRKLLKILEKNKVDADTLMLESPDVVQERNKNIKTKEFKEYSSEPKKQQVVKKSREDINSVLENKKDSLNTGRAEHVRREQNKQSKSIEKDQNMLNKQKKHGVQSPKNNYIREQDDNKVKSLGNKKQQKAQAKKVPVVKKSSVNRPVPPKVKRPVKVNTKPSRRSN